MVWDGVCPMDLADGLYTGYTEPVNLLANGIA